MVAGGLEVSAALLLGLVIDSALASDQSLVFSENVILLTGAAVFFVIVRPFFFGASTAMSSMLIGPNIGALVLSRLHRHTLDQSVSFFDDDFAGRIAQKQLQASRAITDAVVEVVNVLSFAVASLSGSLLLLAAIDYRIACILAVWLIAYFALIRWYLPRIRSRSKSRAAARSMLSGQIVDTITNIRTVKLFAHNRHEDQVALNAMETFRLKVIGFGRTATGFRFYLMTLSGVLPVVLVGGALALWSEGAASAGGIAATGAVSIRIAQMSGWVSFVLMAVYSNVGEAEDGMRTLAVAHKLTDHENARELTGVSGKIEFQNVTFAYEKRDGGLQGVNLAINPQDHIGLVGPSGAGKSTLAALLMRLYDPAEGAILLDGHNLRELTQESLRRKISFVTQETAMFNRSAFENIAYGKPGATKEEIISAARKAEAHDFIMDLSDPSGRTGYEVYLGERGVKLSGGQRQRIALARAVLKDAPILILDEATSALDSTVESSIQDALENVMEGKTVIAIAHRLSTILRMHRIVVLENGRVVETGSPNDLLAQGGHFASQWDKQLSGFINLDQAAQ